MKCSTFEELVQEIHRVNKGWHCFEASSRFLSSDNNYLKSHYLKRKNELQKRLQDEYPQRIKISLEDESNPSIEIKEEYQFSVGKFFLKMLVIQCKGYKCLQ